MKRKQKLQFVSLAKQMYTNLGHLSKTNEAQMYIKPVFKG